MRIRELSKELGLSNNEIINKLKELGIDGKVASSGITAEEEKRLRDRFTGGKKAPKASPEAGGKPEKAEKKAPEVKPVKSAEAQEAGHREGKAQEGRNFGGRNQNDRRQGDRNQNDRRQGDRNQNDRRQGGRNQNDRRQD
ncbi:MAG: translation initiation factor IF-2 N-terminal domain-containing protein, partial [Clostridiales bacterium]|nr:translation initiation factor IF-2 N-terminal domain-containing protein [Clostridiales bacterium]